jgi:Kelch motif/Dockerin type I domain
LNTGGRYNPGTDSWTATSTINGPVGRSNHTAVWTGTEMIVWGGYNGGSFLNTGWRYNPGTDSWTATSAANAPTGRDGHTAVWTGSEMVVWGGVGGGSYLNTGGRYCAQPLATPTETPTPTSAPTQTPSPTPTPTPTVNISGNISYCSNPTTEPVPNVTLTVNGDVTTSTMTDAAGNYMLSLPSGGSYDVTPSKTALLPGSAGINTIDVVATQRHFLTIGTLLTGCRVTAADVNGDGAVNTVDVIAIQRFFLGLSSGIANVGKYQFDPANRTYPGVVSDQTAQNYDTLIFGDVASPFVE